MDDPGCFAGSAERVQQLLGQQHAQRSAAKVAVRKANDHHPIPRHERGERFVRGPIPYEWLQVALAFGGKSGNLSWAMWHLAGMKRTNPIKLTRRVLSDFNISPRSARRLLLDFERAGLVEVDSKRGRGPIVALLMPSPPNIENQRTGRTDSPRMNAKADQ